MSRKDCILKSRSLTSEIVLWNKILRLEIGTEICSDLKFQVDCLQNGDMLSESCGSRASEIHRNLTSLFLQTWCDQAPFISLKSDSAKLNKLAISVLLFVIFLFYLF